MIIELYEHIKVLIVLIITRIKSPTAPLYGY